MKDIFQRLKDFWKTGKKGKFIIVIVTIVILICLCCGCMAAFVIFAPKVFPLPSTSTPTPTPTSTITNTPLPTATAIDTITPTIMLTPRETLTPTLSFTPTKPATSTSTPSSTQTSVPTEATVSYIYLYKVAAYIFLDHDSYNGNGAGIKVYMGEQKIFIFEIIGGGDCPSMPSGQGYRVRYPNGKEEWKDRRAMEESELFVVDDSFVLYARDWKVYYNCP